MVRGPTPPPASSNSGGCLAVVLVIGFILLVAQCSSKGGSSSSVGENAAMTDMNAEGAAAPAPQAAPSSPIGGVEPFDAAAAARGVARERAAASAEGLPGAMIYSQNCYDALGRAFSWSKLDECGAFDAAAAARLTDDDAVSSEKEASYFDGETAAGRYLAAATGAGEQAGEADERWAKLQAKAKSTAAPKRSADEAPAVDEASAAAAPTAAEQVAAEGAQVH